MKRSLNVDRTQITSILTFQKSHEKRLEVDIYLLYRFELHCCQQDKFVIKKVTGGKFLGRGAFQSSAFFPVKSTDTYISQTKTFGFILITFELSKKKNANSREQ